MVRVVFLHPDLGIGGAERLVVDCSLALQARGHTTTLLTAHHDPSHCFAETRPGGPCQVLCRGDWLPRALWGRCQALWASVRMLYLTVYMLVFLPCDVVFVDQVSTPLLLLALSGHPTVFYCHYPDLLLSTGRTWLKTLYRAPLDWLEEVTTGLANTILVNSKFTGGVFRNTFLRLGHLKPAVLYPSLAVQGFQGEGVRPDEVDEGDMITFLSINRYERKKNIGLAVEAFSQLSVEARARSRLVVAGGYDTRVSENVEHFLELVSLARARGVVDQVVFLRSPADQEKVWLLRHSTCLVYTPEGEHFGIVPLESMYCGTPVLAVDSGGPKETVVQGETGWLVEKEGFGVVMEKVVAMNKEELLEMGEAGRKRVEQVFSYEAFCTSLENHVTETFVTSSALADGGSMSLATKFALVFHFGLAMVVLYWMIFQPLP